MRSPLRWTFGCLCAVLVHCAAGQHIHVDNLLGGPQRISVRSLQDDNTAVSGQGFEVPGIDLADGRQTRHSIGDDSSYAARNFVDTAWTRASASWTSVVQDASIHWVRYHLLPDDGVKGVPLILNVEVRGAVDVFHNGILLVHVASMPDAGGGLLPLSDSVPRLTVPLRMLCDGDPEVLAIRIAGAPGTSLAATALHAGIHLADSSYTVQRTMMHYGVFIGINVVILLLALVIGRSERGDRSWLLLALLSLVSVLETFCDLGGEMGTLGLPSGMARALDLLGTILVPWSLYLLIMVLGVMRGDLPRKRARLYTAGVLVMTGICVLVAAGDFFLFIDTNEGFTMDEPGLAVIIAVVVLGVLFGVIVCWFAIEVVRLGIKLLRSKGYERWVGGGALASSLLTLALGLASALTGFGLSSWLSVLADYCSFVAVPVSVAVYLAIRSGHHTQLVTRQRDELDQEVKDRTAQLRTEKERSDELLLNILPHEVAEELKDTGAAAAKHFDQATVLFTDFRGFTRLSEQVSPAELVQQLNICFKVFDGLMEKYRIEKIKTIGDSYMAAGGLPDPRNGGPADVVLAALEMQAFMRQHSAERKAQGLPVFEMRVGIHTGPVVAGIVGVKKFAYDIWGDTVNTASRMESSGEAGRVNISGTTYVLVKDLPGLSFTPRGMVQAKGKGEMEMYFVEMRAT